MSTTLGSSPVKENDDHVQLVQTLLTVPEVFVYRVPPMKTAGGHRAEDWDLANPLKTCKLTLERLDNNCLVKLLAETPKPEGVGVNTSLFAQSIMTIDDHTKLEYYLDFVVDSSRYFVLKIEDKARGRQATIGIGFRERDDASNFRLSLQDYERSLQREKKAEELQEQYSNSSCSTLELQQQPSQENDNGDNGNEPESLVPQVSKLTLKEGEKIRINLKGYENKEPKKASASSSGATAAVPLLKKPPVLLKKPPPPADGNEPLSGEALPIETEASADDVDGDDEWGDFEAPPSS